MIKTVTEFFEKGGKMCECDHEHEGECPEEVCEICGGKNGEHEDISMMESVYPNEPHMADIGSRPCPNSITEHDEYDDQE